MRQLCEDSKEAGIRTLVALDEQGEQLDRVEEDMDKINTDMKEAEKALTGMEQCCGLCTLPCGKSKEFQEDESTWKGNDDGKIVGGQPVRTVDDRGGGMAMTGSYIAKVTKDDREDEMEENMQDVNNMIGNLRNMAIDMGSEIGAQNAQIGRINQKVRSFFSYVLSHFFITFTFHEEEISRSLFPLL
jgi:synaptosomal-associated protein 25